MAISVFDLFSIGIGPSSSHTVGPMKAAAMFVDGLAEKNTLTKVQRVKVELFGSLGATGKGHGSEKAVILGLEGEKPDKFDPKDTESRLDKISANQEISLNSEHCIKFNQAKDLILHKKKSLPHHSNGMTCCAYDDKGEELYQKTYYSIGGGFVVDDNAIGADKIKVDDTKLPYSFANCAELLEKCEKHNLRICELMFENEKIWRSPTEIKKGILKIWGVMQECVNNGIKQEGILPGGLKVKRRAKGLYEDLHKQSKLDMISPGLSEMDWVNVYAIAVNEENAAGGKVVTAPTNGAAGIMPAVLHYYYNHCNNPTEDDLINFFLTAGAIGILYKENASISGAEVGCQGEVGSACSMAAGGLAEAFGGTIYQIENAAEIAMEHNLGLTCDPIGGLVQVPCIERNAVGAVKAINAARMALRNDGSHFVSLDKVIKTMRDTGRDMKDKYKETARGGLAVNVIEC